MSDASEASAVSIWQVHMVINSKAMRRDVGLVMTDGSVIYLARDKARKLAKQILTAADDCDGADEAHRPQAE
jgi:hypothetical protein